MTNLFNIMSSLLKDVERSCISS